MNKEKKIKVKKNNKRSSIFRKYIGAKWGMGIEHEVHFFHSNNQMNFNKPIDSIIACDVTHAIQRVLKNDEDIFQKKGYSILEKWAEENDLPKKSRMDLRALLSAVPAEKSGRVCAGKPALKRIPIFMPEFITRSGNDRNPFVEIKTEKSRKVEQFLRDVESKEALILKIIKDLDQILQKRIKKYGDLTSYPTGMSSHIRVPTMYETHFKKEEGDTDPDLPYTFKKEKDGSYKTYKDYTGSFHITLTLPFFENISTEKFTKMHENFANTIQWIEPLLLTSFFSGDDRCFGTDKKYPRGSFRVMRVGWGNFAGSDVRQFDKGIGRYAVIPSYWRDGLEFDDMGDLSYCDGLSESILKNSPRAVSSLSSNFRTFGSRDPKRPWHRESGLGMTKPNGVEIRIFDHYNINKATENLNIDTLVFLMIYLAENSRVSPPSKYVYENRGWIDTMHECMKHGYLAKIPDAYVEELRNQLGLKLDTKVRHGFRFFEILVKELIEKNKNGEWNTIMLSKHYDKLNLNIERINELSWQLGFLFYADKHPEEVDKILSWIYESILETSKKQGIVKFNDLKKQMEKKFDKKYSNYLMDILEFIWELEKQDVIYVKRDEKGFIEQIKTGHNFEMMKSFFTTKSLRMFLHFYLNPKGMYQNDMQEMMKKIQTFLTNV